MLVICEDCGKKYNVDVSALKTGKGQFNCKKCGHLIMVNVDDEPLLKAPGEGAKKAAEAAKEPKKPEPSRPESGLVFSMSDSDTPMPPLRGTGSKGLPVGVHFMIGLLVLFGGMAAVIVLLNQYFLPPILNEQINLRTAAISHSFSGIVRQPLLERNYKQINEESDRVSVLPGVAYVAVVNNRGVVVAGSLGDRSRFDAGLVQEFEEKGFPKNIIAQNRIVGKVAEQAARLVAGGQKVHDVAVSLGEEAGEIHVGLFTAEMDAIPRKMMLPMLYALAGFLVLGLAAFLFLGRMITRPLVELTETANKISLGQLDLRIPSDGPREVRVLALALERMRVSIQAAIKRLSSGR